MKFSYEDLISGDSIPVDGIGHIRSPFLRELKPKCGIGIWKYNLFLNIMTWEKEDIIKFMELSTGKRLSILEKNKKLNEFDCITILDSTRKVLQEAMSFFMDEELIWEAKKFMFISKSNDVQNTVGYIDRNNFNDVRDMMLQVNYINLGKSAKPEKYSTEKARDAWEQVQKHLKEEAGKKTPDKRMQLGNIISKLSAASVGYTLLNIYDLTVFQLYDQFFQYGYLRAMNLSEMAYSHYGGKDFDIQGWLNPLTNLEKEQK